MKPLLSVIYPYRNRDAERVERSIRSLFSQDLIERFEIILVDYGSDEIIQEQIKSLLKKFPSVRYVFNPTQGMPWSRSHALNTGLKLATADYIFTADVDMIFDASFGSIAERLIQTDKAVFFSVGYLPEKFDYNKPIKEKDYLRSESYALGLALIEKNALEKIRGYDEFYCFWGMEDNDIHHRLQASGCKCSYFESSVLLYHQWHRPANVDLPIGWRTCMGEYFEANKPDVVRNKNHEWGRILASHERTAWHSLKNKISETDKISSRKIFFEWHLTSKFEAAASRQTIIGEFTDVFSGRYLKAKPGRMAALLKKAFHLFRLPLDVSTVYRDQFMTARQARDSFFYFIHFHRFQIADYAFRFNEKGGFEFAFTKI